MKEKYKERFKLLCKTIKYVHSVTKMFYFVILLDILLCNIIYGISSNEYRIFCFYSLKPSLRRTYLSKRRHDRFIDWHINKNELNIFNNKKMFNDKFKKYINRNIININEFTFKGFEEFAIENQDLLCMSESNSFDSSYKVYSLKDFRSPAYMSDKIKKDKLFLIEKKFNQHDSLDEISENLIIISVVSIINKKKVNILCSTIKFRDNNKSIMGFVDINSGTIKGKLKDENGELYKDMNNYNLPNYKDIKEMVKELANITNKIKEVEWNFVVNNKGKVYLVDANVWEDTIFVQQPEYLNNRVGLLHDIQKYNRG